MNRKIALGIGLLAGLAVTLLCVKGTKRDASPGFAATELSRSVAVVISAKVFPLFKEADFFVSQVIQAGARVIILNDEPVAKDQQERWLQTKGIALKDRDAIDIIPVSHDSHWVRDFTPVVTRFRKGFANQTFLTDFDFRDVRLLEDTASYQMALYLRSNVIHAPIVIDGGNFLSDGKTCIATDDFSIESETPDADGTQANNTEEARRLFHDYFGCDQLKIVQNAPHDHIDMLAKFVRPGVVAVNQIDLTDIGRYKLSPQDEELNRKAAQSLDEAARMLAKGLTVERLPMPLIETTVFRTYANSLIVNQTAIVPRFRQNQITEAPYSDHDRIDAYEARVQKLFESNGYKVVFVAGDDLISHGGALHCIANHLPELTTPRL